MMKKLFLLSAAFCSLAGVAQNIQLKVQEDGTYNPTRSFQPANSPNSVVSAANDTLHYFFNKHYYRNSTATVAPSGAPANSLFYTIPIPYTSTTQLSYCGSIFTNTTTIQVVGLEAIVARDASSASLSIPTKLYICSLNASNFPIMPPLDSVTVNISATSNVPWSGGNFSSPVTVTGKFAVLVNIASTIAGDTIRPFLNNASTPASTATPLQRYGEGLGVMRVNGNYMTTATAFGGGADYEFLVAPRVVFSYTAGVSAATPTVCTNGIGTFSNTSAPVGVLEHRQFNFIQFYRTWRAPLTVTTSLAPMPPLDSLYNWTFTGSSSTQSFQKNPSVTFTLSGTQTGQLSTVYRPSANAGFVTSFTDVATGNLNVNTSAAPVIAITGNTAICSGNSTTLTASGNPTFTWTTPATTSSSVIVNPTSNTVYTVTADNGGCVSTRTIMVVVSSPANVSVSVSQACILKVYTLTATGANTYSWSNAATSTSITAVTSTPGVVQYTVTGVNAGCPPSVVVTQVTVNDLPNVTLSAAKNKVCKSDPPVTLTGAPSGGFYSGQNVVGSVFNPLIAGTITATYSYTDPATTCSKNATTSIIVELCTTDIMKNSLNSDVNVYPNPSLNGLVHVKNLEGVNTLQLFNILGMKLSEVVTDKSDYTFDLSSKSNGNYFIRIIDAGGNSKTVKIVNQN